MSLSNKRYTSLEVYEPKYANGVTVGLNTNFLYGLGGWELKTQPTSIHPNYVKRVCIGWNLINSNIQVTKMVLQRTTTSRNYEVHVHEDMLKDTKLHDYIVESFRDPSQNCLPVMFVLKNFDGGNIVIFPQKITYLSSKRMYTFTCADEKMITDSLHICDNTPQLQNSYAHQFQYYGTVEAILQKVFTLSLYNHRRRINLYEPGNTGHLPNVGKLPTGLLTNANDVICLADPWGWVNDMGDPETLFRTTIPSGFKVNVQYRNKTTQEFTFVTKKIKLSDVISELNSKLKIRIRTSLKFVNGELVLFVNCLSEAPKELELSYSDFSIIFDQTQQSHLSYQNYDKMDNEIMDIASIVGYPQHFKDTYETIYPFFKTAEVESKGDNPAYDDMMNGQKTPTLKYNFDNVVTDAVINSDLFVGDTISFRSEELNKTLTATVNGYTITFDENNKYSQILEIEVI